MEYKPLVRRKGIRHPWGYFISPFDQNILLPDPKKLDALHYAFRMKAKYKTPIRSCTMWLHMATGQLMTPAGFMYAYDRWVKKLKIEKRSQIKTQEKELLKAQQQLIKDTYGNLEVVIDDRAGVAALAHERAAAAWKKKEAEATR